MPSHYRAAPPTPPLRHQATRLPPRPRATPSLPEKEENKSRRKQTKVLQGRPLVRRLGAVGEKRECGVSAFHKPDVTSEGHSEFKRPIGVSSHFPRSPSSWHFVYWGHSAFGEPALWTNRTNQCAPPDSSIFSQPWVANFPPWIRWRWRCQLWMFLWSGIPICILTSENSDAGSYAMVFELECLDLLCTVSQGHIQVDTHIFLSWVLFLLIPSCCFPDFISVVKWLCVILREGHQSFSSQL